MGVTYATQSRLHRMVNATMTLNWRTGKRIFGIVTVPESRGPTAYSYFNDQVSPIAYVSEQPECMYPMSLGCACNDALMDIDRFPYTADTYSNPEKLWLFV
jgi:hypothetical protein